MSLATVKLVLLLSFAINYGGIAAYKTCILFFNLVPWVALSLAT